MLFQSVVGQRSLASQFIKEINGGKISHAHMFLGHPGNGSLALCLAYVRYLFCENRSETDSCGSCPSCLKMNELQHPDVHFSFPIVLSISKIVDPLLGAWREMIKRQPYADLNTWISEMDPKLRRPMIGTDASQEIIRKLSLKSFEGGYKVMVIWMAGEMNLECSNKLLKILEEPPAKTIFFLLAEKQEGILPTILSRTQTTVIPSILDEDLVEHLISISDLDESAARSIVGRVQGNLLECYQAMRSEGSHTENRDWFMKLMRVCYAKQVNDMLDWAEMLASEGKERQKNFMLYALHMLRQSMLRNYTSEQLLRVSPEEATFLSNFSRFITGNNIFDFHKTLNDAHYHLDRNANPKILFTNITFQVMRYIHVA
jgi:DNA polymerase-3 subunit delta'